jgi:predicted DsbA family dithiol-disulfide isomerase
MDNAIVVYSDIACPWAHVAVYRLRAARSRSGLDAAIAIDHRAFPLELFNERPTPKAILDAEMPVTAALEPDAGWRAWSTRPEEYPVSSLLALEAVQAAKEQSMHASEQLDRALRLALFKDHRCISMFHVVMDVAARVATVDTKRLRTALESGRARRMVFDQMRDARRIGVEGSPHLYLPDGSGVHNPGISKEWICGEPGEGFPVVHADDASVYERMVRRIARRSA